MLNTQQRILLWRRRVRVVAILQIAFGFCITMSSAGLWAISNQQKQVNITATCWVGVYLLTTGISNFASHKYLRAVWLQKLFFTLCIIMFMLLSVNICLKISPAVSHKVCHLDVIYQTQYNGGCRMFDLVCLYVQLAIDTVCLLLICLSLAIICTAISVPAVNKGENVEDIVEYITIMPNGKA